MWRFNKFILVLLLVYCIKVNSEKLCPLKCACSRVKPKAQFQFTDLFKLKCGTPDSPIQELSELYFNTYPNVNEVSILDLSENEITKLPLFSLNFPVLHKLDFNRNNISVIEPGAFSNLTNLRFLILSNNKISFLSKELFEGLNSLEVLKIGSNSIVQLKEGTFSPLLSIAKIDLSSNPFLCNCDLLWLPDWAWNNSIKLIPPPKCYDPLPIRGQLLDKLHASSSHLKCDWLVPDVMQVLELKPSQSQIVFEGDSLKLQCRVVNADATDEDTIMNWSYGGQDPIIVFDQTVQIESKFPRDSGTRESSVIIDHINKNHSGNWDCDFISGDINHTSTISVIVISEDTKYCPSSTTTDNRGTYTWPKTVVGFTSEIPCLMPIDDDYQDDDPSGLRATRVCSPQGDWQKLNTSACPFTNPNTRLLQHFSKMNLTNKHGGSETLISTAKKIQAFLTSDVQSISDPQDVVFIMLTIENYLDFIAKEKELGAILIDITSYLMKLPKEVLLASQLSDKTCSRLVSAVETITAYTPTLQSHKSNLAVEEFRITRESFFGITCSWYTGDKESNRTNRFFLCDTTNKTAQIATKHKVVDASVQMPPSLFYQLEIQGIHVSSHQLMIAMYENSHLFPRKSTVDGKDVTSSVVGIKLVDQEVNSLTNPVYVTLKVPPNDRPHVPAWWDQNAGDWRTDGCQVSRYFDDLLMFQCYRLGYFALLENIQTPVLTKSTVSKVRFSHPSIYIGTFVGVTCLFMSSMTYIVCYPSIHMAKKMKHSLANTWICMSMFCLVFSLGVRQTENERWCQWIGVMLHYFCLASLFWMAVTVKAMYKRLPKPKLGSSSSSDELPHDDIVIKKPILGIYMVGYGISLIICGLSSAVNMRGYAGQAYCFLSPGPALSAIIIPSVILLVFLSIMCLLVRCIALSHLDSNAQLSDGTQATDLELMDATGCTLPTERTSLHSVITPSSQVEDSEHSPLTHLKAFIIVLLIYLFVVVSGAMATMTPASALSYEEPLFSILYCVFCILLGTFVIFFYCFTRTDVRTGCFKIRCKSKPLYRSRTIIDSNNMPLPVLSNSQSLSSSNQLKSIAADLNGSVNKNENFNKTNSLGLVVLQPRYTNNDTIINNFYNPHQSTAARKFFKKQRRKQNNFPLPTRQNDTLNSSILGQSKINNTNIHVDMPLRDSKDKNMSELRMERFKMALDEKPLHNNDGTLRLNDVKSNLGSTTGPEYVEVDSTRGKAKANNSEYDTEDFTQSQTCESVGEREDCSCDGVSEVTSDLVTDCDRRDISTKLSCNSFHGIVSDVSDASSHLYATVAPEIADSSLERRNKSRHKADAIKIHNDLMNPALNEMRRKKANKNYSLPRRKRERERGNKVDEEDKKETCL